MGESGPGAGVALRGVRVRGVLCVRVWVALEADERDVRRGGPYMVERVIRRAGRPRRCELREWSESESWGRGFRAAHDHEKTRASLNVCVFVCALVCGVCCVLHASRE